jgi:transposase
VSTDSPPPKSAAAAPLEPGHSPAASACEPYRELIAAALAQGRNAMAIWQDLVDGHGFPARYASVMRFVRQLRGASVPEAHAIIQTPRGEEGQVDYGQGPMVRHPATGKYRRTRLFVFTLGYSRKSVRLLAFRSSTRLWAELHERTFLRLGAAPRVVILDNLREGVLHPDIYDPTLNPLYRDVLAHYGVTALPCRVRDADRKGKVESGVGHAQGTPLKGLRFETLAAAQAYLDHWETRWADTRIHGTTKRQVAAMFAEERPHLQPLPPTPFRYYAFGTRTVHPDGCVEVAKAYYRVPPGRIGEEVAVQWDERVVRVLDPTTHALLREHERQHPGGYREEPEDRPRRTPPGTLALLARAATNRLPRRRTRHEPPRRRSLARRPAHPGPPGARPQAWRRARRPRLRRRPRPRRPLLPGRPPLPRAPSARAGHPPPGRPADPPAHPLSRSPPGSRPAGRRR